MAKYNRRSLLIEKSFAFQKFGKRHTDLSESEKREYNRIKKAESRKKEHILENEHNYYLKRRYND